ncbi:hypothetical protein FBZ99_10844 [Rhizobium sp. ERR 1071]|uniref:hypothetical protein n=1 Tax=Rhizobium sp. ERR 1071 TaxID=2572677 RepID=UPI0011992D97|nr:hypothetical protein [Rhizobium sp. ERR1071]TWB11663.1 hypothetical protein FBZ99_10844 [Rhizobium sp. ERR1071]
MTFADPSKYPQPPSSADDISIWCDKDPALTALAAKAAYGTDATLAVAWCALGAKVDGRAADGHFWFKVFCLLSASETQMRAVRPARRGFGNADVKLN